MEKEKIIDLINADVFQQENLILSDVNLQIVKGEFVYLIGKVGTGKSSLIKTLNAELPLMSGNGIVCDHQLSKIKQKEIANLRRKMGVVFQDFRLLTDRNISDNLAFVLKATGWKNKIEINKRINETLAQVDMVDKQGKWPHQLSGGEQQRIVIARAILNHPVLILADEPTGNLDPETSEQILDLFIKLNKEGKTVLMATHDYAVIAKKPARTLVCTDGGIIDSAKNEARVDFENLLELNE